MSRFLKSLGSVGMSGLLLLVLPVAANAATINFNFDTCGNGTTKNASCGASTTYNSGGYSITATAETPASHTGTLYAKQDGGDENGLGLTNDPSHDNEITAGSFIQLTIPTSLVGTPLTIAMGSTTDGEEWQIFENTTSGTLSGGTSEGTGKGEGTSDELTFTPGAGDLYIDVTSLDGNVLLSSLSFTPAATPEPGGLALLGTGVLGLAGVVRRKLKV